MTEQTSKKVEEIICDHLGICGDELDPKLSFSDDYNVGAEEIRILADVIEEELEIELSQDKIAEVVTVGDLVAITKDALAELE